MELPVRNTEGEVVSTAEVSDALFAVPMNRAVVHQALVMYQANRRQGTHSTKTRSQVSGGGRKPWRQKYIGRARQGSTRAPQWQHGGVAFGPHPRSYRQRMPQQMRRLALQCVLSTKAREEQLVLLENLSLAKPSTKEMARILQNLGHTTSTLIVTKAAEPTVVRSARNLPKIWTLPASLLNAGVLLRFQNVVMTLDAVRLAEELWAQEKTDGGKERQRP
ncbi:MAG: 50S ribosomal protein L4 [Dehalococcoidia bacterium]